MKRERLTLSTLVVLAALALPAQLTAQHTRYKLIDIGTLGGPSAGGQGNGNGTSQFLTGSGTVVGGSDTSIPDPNAPNCGGVDCFLSHAFRWQRGVLADLGTLPGGNFSGANWIDARGWIAGYSQTAEIDPVAGFPAGHAVLWKDSKIIDLGTLGTGIESATLYVNNGGMVVGQATVDTTADPFSFFGFGPFPSPTHVFTWKNGVMRDLGTLGGPDSYPSAGCNNDRDDLVAGVSFINSTPNLTTGIPTADPFLWQSGTMADLGSLGGTVGFSQCANNRAQVTGWSNLAGDSTFHPFFWDRGVITDIGTFGGDNGFPTWMNNAGEVVGRADFPDGHHDGFLWRNGVKTDLGALGTQSTALQINSSHQIVGASRINDETVHAFLWEDGGPMLDLNDLIPANSSLQLVVAFNINDRGEITGLGAPPGVVPFGSDAPGLHPFLLIPCESDISCENKADATSAAIQHPVALVNNLQTKSTGTPRTPFQMLAPWRARLAQHQPGAVEREE
jgi:probable HAF family extracellular repeat protein